jgi:hypothetical protein
MTFVVGARIRVDQRDRERLDTGFDEIANDLLDLIGVDGLDHLALRVYALVRLAGVLERGGRVGLDHDDPAGKRARSLRAREVEDLPEAPGRDQADAGSLRLEQCVRCHSRAVHHVREVRW